jgi:sugar phosphate isomerase/epimerase
VKLALSSFSVPWAVGIPGSEPAHPLAALDLLELAGRCGLHRVQFADNLPLHRLDEAALDAVESRAGELGIGLQVGTRGLGQWLIEYVELAVRFGSPFVRVVIDADGDHPTPAETIGRLRPFERAFRDAGVRLAIENHDRFRTDELLHVLDELGDWTAICLDTVNSLGCLETPKAVVDALGSRTINLHLKDFVIRRHSHQLGFEVVGTPAGEGMLDIPWLLSCLDHAVVDTAVLELWTPPASTLEETVALEFEWVERSLAKLASVQGLDFD